MAPAMNPVSVRPRPHLLPSSALKRRAAVEVLGDARRHARERSSCTQDELGLYMVLRMDITHTLCKRRPHRDHSVSLEPAWTLVSLGRG